jgi:streptogrisin C
VTSPASGGTFSPGQTVTGNVPAAPASAVAAGSTVSITVSGQAPFDVPVDDAGNWRFTPEAVPGAAAGGLSFTAETINGFSRSGPSAFEFAPAATETPAPPVTEPAPQPPVSEPAVPAPAQVPLTPSTVAPAGAATVVEPPGTNLPDRSRGRNLANTSLADTGADGVLTAAAAAVAGIAVGGVLMVLARRRNRQPK